jgi:hypothetical protein
VSGGSVRVCGHVVQVVRLNGRAGEFCAACGRVLVGRRSNAVYCDAACRKRGWRRTRVGLAADEFRTDGRRGSTSLEERARALGLLTARRRVA